jgi:hypothetical protein
MSLDLFPYFRGKMKKKILQLIWEFFLPHIFAYHWVLNGTYYCYFLTIAYQG